MEKEGEGLKGVEMVGGDGSETGLMKKNGKKIDDWYRCQEERKPTTTTTTSLETISLFKYFN